MPSNFPNILIAVRINDFLIYPVSIKCRTSENINAKIPRYFCCNLNNLWGVNFLPVSQCHRQSHSVSHADCVLISSYGAHRGNASWKVILFQKVENTIFGGKWCVGHAGRSRMRSQTCASNSFSWRRRSPRSSNRLEMITTHKRQIYHHPTSWMHLGLEYSFKCSLPHGCGILRLC